MTNLRKIGLTALAGTLAATVNAQAGELTVGGTARIEIQSNQVTTAGVETETDSFLNNGTLTFSGSGELDNGFNVSYYQALADGSLTSSNVVVDMGDMGTLSIADHGGVAGIDAVQDIVPNGGEQPWDDIGTHGGHEDGVAAPHTGDRIGYAINASGFTISAAADAAPDGGTKSAAINASGLVEGLTIVAGIADAQSTATTSADVTTYGLSYTVGPISFGAQRTDVDEDTVNADVERDAYGASFMVNENLSIGFGVSDVEYDDLANDEESREIGVVYTSGGMTVGLQNIEKDGINGTAVDHEMTELQLTFAF
jgi:outer membrane protein OmpU